jgi:hypothetical protein
LRWSELQPQMNADKRGYSKSALLCRASALIKGSPLFSCVLALWAAISSYPFTGAMEAGPWILRDERE